MTSIRLEMRVKVRRAKAKAKAKANPKVRGKVRTKVRRRKKLMQRRVWIRSEQPQLEAAKAHFQEIALLWTAGPMCGSNTKKTCLRIITKMYFTLLIANVIAAGRPH